MLVIGDFYSTARTNRENRTSYGNNATLSTKDA